MTPIFPKSNSKLQIGHFWPIKLSNGRFAFGVVVDLPDKKSNTKHFVAGLLNLTSETIPLEQDFEKYKNLKIIELGQAHIKAITFEGRSIIGKINFQSLRIEIPLQLSQVGYQPTARILQGYKTVRFTTAKDHKVLETQGCWGYNYINILAETQLVEK